MNPFGPGPTGPGRPQQPNQPAAPQSGFPRPGGPDPQNPFGQGGPVGTPGGGQPPFGGPQPSPTSTGGSLDPVGPPKPILIAAGVLAALGIVLGAVFWGSSLSVLGWVAAGPLAIGVLALFTSRDTSRRAAAVYLRPDWITAAYAVVIGLIVVGVIVSSVGFAMWIGHR